MFAGTGVGGTVFPFIVSALLSKFGYKATMISLGIGFGLLNGVALMFIKRRIPLRRDSKQSRRDHGAKSGWKAVDWSFLRKRGIWTAMFVSTVVRLSTNPRSFCGTVWETLSRPCGSRVSA